MVQLIAKPVNHEAFNMPRMPYHEALGILHNPNHSGASKWGKNSEKRPPVVRQEIGSML
jgi:hypothetical protein